MMQPVEFRNAEATDGDISVALIYSSGSSAFEYGFSRGKYQAIDFLAFAFADGRGFFGWRNHTVAVLDGGIVGIGAFYSGQDYLRLSVGLVWQILRFYQPTTAVGVFWRIHQLQALMPRPTKNMHYVANFAVCLDMQGKNIGTAMLRDQQAIAKQLGRSHYALDVSVDNPRAKALYERLGFGSITVNKFTGKTNRVADTLRMEMLL